LDQLSHRGGARARDLGVALRELPRLVRLEPREIGFARRANQLDLGLNQAGSLGEDRCVRGAHAERRPSEVEDRELALDHRLEARQRLDRAESTLAQRFRALHVVQLAVVGELEQLRAG